MKSSLCIILVALLVLANCNKQEPVDNKSVSTKYVQAKIATPEKISTLIKDIEPFHRKIGEPEPGEWLTSFTEEGQTFNEYINSKPTLPTDKRTTIYIQPIGSFNLKQSKIIKLTQEFMEKFYNLPVKLLRAKKFKQPMSLENQRTHPQWNIKQVRTGYILDEMLEPNLPDDAAAMISLTNMDLYPDRNFNYVFGQASLKNRVGVWSLYRLEQDASDELFLRRVLKLAIHETGHMFSIYHCVEYSCAMNGTNHIVESDKRPLDFCPEDTAKIIWMRDADPKKRYSELSNFCFENGLSREGNLFEKLSKKIMTK